MSTGSKLFLAMQAAEQAATLDKSGASDAKWERAENRYVNAYSKTLLEWFQIPDSEAKRDTKRNTDKHVRDDGSNPEDLLHWLEIAINTVKPNI